MMVDGVENKRHRHKDKEDRISAIPDSLIHHILSFLKMKNVIKTSLLSRRWRNLWRTTPVLNFGYYCTPCDTTTFINLSLMHYNGRKIRRFHVKFGCEVDSCHLDSWIRFVMMRDVEELDIHFFSKKVEELDIHFFSDNYKFDNENLYKLPFSILDGGQFKVLVLESCVLRFPKSVCFRSLMKLHLSCVDLDTSGCPLLEVLILKGCSRSLNIHAPNQTLRYLKIQDDQNVLEKNCCLSLYAPNLLSIKFHGFLRGSYKCKKLSSLESAILEFDAMNVYEEDVASLAGLLKSVSCAKTLKLSERTIWILDCTKKNYIKTLPLSATVLEIEASLDKHELTVVVASLLRNAHCLETLIINVSDLLCYDNDISWESLELALSASLQLKTVIIRSHGFWPYNQEENLNIDKYMESWTEELELIKLLLKSCKLLDKVIIRTMLPGRPLKSELLSGVAKKLLQFPRASITAKIALS